MEDVVSEPATPGKDLLMDEPERTDAPIAGNTPARSPKRVWRAPVIALAVTLGLVALSVLLDRGDERARDLALLIGAPTLYLLLPLVVIWLLVTVVLQVRRGSSTSD